MLRRARQPRGPHRTGQQQQRLDRSTQGSGKFRLFLRLLKQRDGLLIQLNSFRVLVERVHGICLRAEAPGQKAWLGECLRNIHCRIGSELCTMSVHSNFLPNFFSQGLDNFIPGDRRMLRDHFGTALGIRKRQQALDHGLGFGLLHGANAHWD